MPRRDSPAPDFANAPFTAIERLPEAEIRHRQQCCLRHLAAAAPEAGGLLVQGRTNVYYLTGTLAAGMLWLPQEGEPVLLVRKGLERARLESPLRRIVRFKSFKELPAIAADAGKAYLGLHGQAHAGFQRRGKAPREGWPLVQVQAYAVAEEGKLVLAEAHEAPGKAEALGLRLGVEPDFGRNCAWPESLQRPFQNLDAGLVGPADAVRNARRLP